MTPDAEGPSAPPSRLPPGRPVPPADRATVVVALQRAIPMRRLADPADVAHAVAFFASAGASFVTGLSVSGGLTMAG